MGNSLHKLNFITKATVLTGKVCILLYNIIRRLDVAAGYILTLTILEWLLRAKTMRCRAQNLQTEVRSTRSVGCHLPRCRRLPQVQLLSSPPPHDQSLPFGGQKKGIVNQKTTKSLSLSGTLFD